MVSAFPKIRSLFSADTNVMRLSQDQTEVFLRLLMQVDDEKMLSGNDLIEGVTRITADNFLANVLVRRLASTSLEYSVLTVLWCSMLCTNPAIAVMWAYSLMDETRKNGPVTLSRWVDLMPNGVPTDDFYKDTWELQKDHLKPNGNSLDAQGVFY